MLDVQNISTSYGKTRVLHDISFSTLELGSVVAVIGPNGTGKSTLFKCMAGIKKIDAGAILLDGEGIGKMASATLARRVCYMPQNTYTNAALTVFEVVLMGRRFATTSKLSVKEDAELVSQLLFLLNIEHLAERYLSDLSGGQRQLATLAQAIVRKPEYLLLDEPTSALDLHYQIESLDLIVQITKEFQITTFIALHDLSLAGRYADFAMVLHNGYLQQFAPIKEVITEAMIKETYQVHSTIMDTPHGLYVLPHESLNSRNHNFGEIAKRLNQE